MHDNEKYSMDLADNSELSMDKLVLLEQFCQFAKAAGDNKDIKAGLYDLLNKFQIPNKDPNKLNDWNKLAVFSQRCGLFYLIDAILTVDPQDGLKTIYQAFRNREHAGSIVLVLYHLKIHNKLDLYKKELTSIYDNEDSEMFKMVLKPYLDELAKIKPPVKPVTK